jgi:hypothetical protein
MLVDAFKADRVSIARRDPYCASHLSSMRMRDQGTAGKEWGAEMVLETPRSGRDRSWPEAPLLIRLDRSAHHVAGAIVHGAVIVSPEHRSGIWHGHFLRLSLLDPPEISVELVHARGDCTRKRHRPPPLPGANAATRNPMRHLWAVFRLADQPSTAQRWQLHCASTARVPGTNDSAGHARRGALESCVARRVGDMRPAR